MKILLSIKPEFVEKIFDGTKGYEYRKCIFKRNDVKTVVVYSTQPVGQIVGEFEIDEVMQAHPTKLWDATQHASGIDIAFYEHYFGTRERAFAFKIGSMRLYNPPINPEDIFDHFVPPQSFCYLDENIVLPPVDVSPRVISSQSDS